MIKLVVSDIDGTIIDNIHPICKENIEATSYLKSTNTVFAVCTGKSYAICKDFCKTLQADFGIFGNGNQIIDLKTGKEIFSSFLTANEIKEIVSILQKYNLHTHCYTTSSILTPSLCYMDLRNSILFPNKMEINIVNDIYNYIRNNNSNILQVVASSPNSLLDVKNELKSQLDVTITHINKTGIYKDKVANKEYEYLDITAPNTSKGNAVKFLAKYLNLEKDEILAIGDNLNDIDMLEVSGTRVAVNTAYDELKNIADYITSRSAKDGAFAEAVYKFI